MKKGDYLELKITGYAFEGKGISKIPNEENPDKKFVVFAEGAYPGDTVKVQIRKKKKSYAEGKTVQVLDPSTIRVVPKCKYFGFCGGCKQQDMVYEKQLKYKEEQVKDIFERIGGFNNVEIDSILASEKQFYYRNKMEFSFSDKRWLLPNEINEQERITDQNFALGMHIPRIYDKVLDIDECWLQSSISNEIVNFTRKFFREKDTSIYSTTTHTGFLRNLVIKQSLYTNDLMVNLITSSEDEDLLSQYTKEIVKSFGEITTVVNNVNLKKGQVAFGDFEKVY